MIIKKLELQGFKSFPEKTKILFHRGITAIIGPNGTGKSNIVDGILWVLGGQRMKSLRGERTEDIIFNGNAKKPALGMADVVLFLGNEEEELIINHRAFRSGESEYRLNGKMVRLKDIQDSLWKKDIAEKEYFVIEQGAIGLFLTSKPAEKRLLLEEAAGTAYYKDKRKQAESKLETSEQNLIRLEDIITEVSRAKNSLQRQAQAAARYRKLRERIRQLAALNLRRKIDHLETSHRDVSSRYKECLDEEKEMMSRVKSEEKELSQKRKEIWDLEKALKQGQENLFGLKSQITRNEAEIEKEIKRIEFFQEKRKKAKVDGEENSQELVLIEKELDQTEKSLEELNQSSKEKQEELSRTKEEGRAAQEKIAAQAKQLEKVKAEYFQKLSKLTEMKNEGAKVEKELELSLRQEEKLKNRLEQGQTLLKEKEKTLDQIQGNLEEIEKLREERKKTLAELQNALELASSFIEKKQKKVAELKEKRDEDEFHLQALRKLEEKERGEKSSENIPEALGILADLIEADPDCAPLIDIFWKEEAKSIVVHAQDFLKNLIGKEIKGNFLLIHPGKKEEFGEEPHSDPNVIGLFKSRLRPHPKIENFLPHLREAVIVRNINSAVELWLRFPKLNFISLEGDLLLSSGLLKVGQKEEGFFSLNREIKKLNEKIAIQDGEILPAKAELEERIKQKKELEEKLQIETVSLAEEERKFQEEEKGKILVQAEKEKTSSDNSLLRQELEVSLSDKKALMRNMEALSEKIKALSEEENLLKEKEEEEGKGLVLHQEKSAEEEKHLLELKASCDLLQEKIQSRTQQMLSLRQRKESLSVKIRSAEEEIQNSEAEESKLKEHIQEWRQKRKKLEEEKSQKEADLAESEIHLRKAQGGEEEFEKKIKKISEEYEGKKEERVKWEISKAEIERDLVNLEETCWQELKKTLKEVKEEIAREKILDSEVEEKLKEANEELQKFKAVNLMAEEEYISQKKRYDFLIQQRKDLRQSIDSTQEAIKKIDEESKAQFLRALAEVNKNLGEVFSLLFQGGTAELKLTDETNPLESGVDIIAQPPGKRVQNMLLLSGGEKALTSLAFFFGLFRFKPTPFCILDEVDAALDDVNLARFLELMKKIKSETQFIIITHNYKTMEVADYIYGTTMAEPNITQLYSMKMEKKETALEI